MIPCGLMGRTSSLLIFPRQRVEVMHVVKSGVDKKTKMKRSRIDLFVLPLSAADAPATLLLHLPAEQRV